MYPHIIYRENKPFLDYLFSEIIKGPYTFNKLLFQDTSEGDNKVKE